MKKFIVLILAASFFTACNSNKAKDGSTKTESSQEKTSDKDKDKDKEPADKKSDNSTPNDKPAEPAKNNADGTTDYTAGGGWPVKDINDFISNCVSQAVKGGMQRLGAQRYCDCMQERMEKLYPNINDMAGMTDADLQTPSMQRMVKDCLGMK